MAVLRVTAPDGKVLRVETAPGTDPSAYGQAADEAVQQYSASLAPKNPADLEKLEGGAGAGGGAPEGAAGYPVASYTETPPEVGFALSGAMPNAFQGVGSAIWKGIKGIPGLLPNPSIKGLGYGAAQLGTEAGQDLARAARSYAVEAQPEVGDLVAQAKNAALRPPAGSQLALPPGGEVPPVAGPSPQGAFQSPIAQGMARSAEQMRDATNLQWDQVGKAIENTLQGLDNSGTQYDPEKVLKQIEGMYERDAGGQIMSTGVQGETNQAISDALASMKDFANGDKISWKDANRIKSMLQDSANYAAKRFDESNEAYKQVASLIKESIDDQAGSVLSQNGGNIVDFQKLRDSYRSLSSLRSSLNAATGKEMLKPSIAERVVGSIKRAAPYVVGYDVLRRMNQ